MQNKPLNFFLDGGLPNRGVGSDIWEKLPKNPVFFFWQAPLQKSHILMSSPNFCCRPRIWLPHMSFGNEKSMAFHLRHKIKTMSLSILTASKLATSAVHVWFLTLENMCTLSVPMFVAAFAEVKMLKPLIFMSQTDRLCFSHFKTHVGKLNLRSEA